MEKQERIILIIPLIIGLIGLILFCSSFVIKESSNPKLYSIDISVSPFNESLEFVTFNEAIFYYDFSLEKGYLKFSPNDKIKHLDLYFPSELINSSLKIYSIDFCTNNPLLFCNKTEIEVEKQIRHYKNDRPFYPIEFPEITSRSFIVFEEMNLSKDYMIEFKLKKFIPEGIIKIHRTGIPLLLWSGREGNLVFELGEKYSCINCFYGEENLEEEYWSSNEIIRLSIPNQSSNPSQNVVTSTFRISTIPKRKVQLKNDLFSIGLSIFSTMLAIFLTFLFEFKIRKKTK